MVLQLCLGYTKGNRDLAEDLGQETFIHIWKALPTFRNESSHKTWIYRITVNTCLLYIRSNKNKPGIADTDIQLSVLRADDTPPDEYAELYEAIGKLPELDRIIIMLVLEGLDNGEISNIMGIGAINIRVKIHRIRKKMKQLLTQSLING